MKRKNSDFYVEDIVRDVQEDFKQRQIERKSFENEWLLNINFYIGNQYTTINGRNELEDYSKQYFWQEKEVYNHITPIVDLRMSKLNRVRPSMSVVPFSDEEQDIACAEISKKILKATTYKTNLSKLIQNATMWSEICGTSFYKIIWNDKSGKKIGIDENGVDIYEGDIDISVVSPFEIYPDSSCYTNIEDCKSIIHAKSYHVDEIKNIWGVDVEGKDIDTFTLDVISSNGGLGYNSNSSRATSTKISNQCIVIEKYEQPSVKYPFGRLIIVADDKLLYMGDLPYQNQEDGKYGFPFVKQVSVVNPGCFWGGSIISRCIPIQRSYNAVKNRKHEFLNRLSMGVLAVEDGSVDTDDLEEEGLSPGKILVYRQGSNLPKMINTDSVPTDFTIEEERLLTEFLAVSGVNDLLRNEVVSSGNISGVALQLLIEQDETKLVNSAEQIRDSVKSIAKNILRLYKQFVTYPHTCKIVENDGCVEMFYFKNSNIRSDEIIFETENELNETLAQKRSTILELYNSGLLHDENGKISNSVRYKILEQYGFGIWENSQDIKTLQIKRANKENFELFKNKGMPLPKMIDDHVAHINTHTCYMLGDEYEKLVEKHPEIENKILEHIKLHKELLNVEQRNNEK